MSAMLVEGFHTILICRNWEECVAFYRDLLEFRVVDSKPGFVEVEVAPGAHIGLIRSARENDSENRDSSLILTFRVANLDKVHEILSTLCRNVTEIIEHPWGARLFRMRDPEERMLEIWSRI